MLERRCSNYSNKQMDFDRSPRPLAAALNKCGLVSMATGAEETFLFLLNDGQRVGNTLEPSISIHLRTPTGRAT